MLRKSPLLLLVMLLACSGNGDGPDPTGSASGPSPISSADPLATQQVVVAYGAKVVEASLLTQCVEDECERFTLGAKKTIRVDENKPILTITFEELPDTVEVVLKTEGRRGPAQALRPGALVAWRPKLPKGLHDVRIAATYSALRYEWTFLLRY